MQHNITLHQIISLIQQYIVMFQTQAFNSGQHKNYSPNKINKLKQKQINYNQTTVSLSLSSLFQYYKTHFQDCVKPLLTQFFVLPGLVSHQTKNQLLKPFQLIRIQKISINPDNTMDNTQSYDYFFQDEALFYCASGSIELAFKDKKDSYSQNESSYKKIGDIKEDSFFTLINYKNLQNTNPDYLKMIPKCECQIGKIAIRKPYGYEWLRRQYKKLIFLTSILYYDEQHHQDLRRIIKFKQLSSLITQQNFRRDMIISFQEKESYLDKIYFLEQGQITYYKQINHIKHGISSRQSIQICNSKEGAIINAELLLQNNVKTYQLIKNLQSEKTTHFQQYQKDHNQETLQEAAIAKKSMEKIFRLLGKSICQKVILRKNNQIAFYYPLQSISNFTIKANSANVRLYSISIKSLMKNINESMKDHLTKYCEDFYLRLIRRTIQKFDHFIKMTNTRDQNQKDAHTTVQGLLQGIIHHNFGKSHQPNGISVNKLQMQMNSNQHYTNLKNAKIALKRSNNLDKKIQLLMNKQKSNINYKQKIEQIIIKNLKNVNLYKPSSSIIQPKHQNSSSPNYVRENCQQQLQQQQQIIHLQQNKKKYSSVNKFQKQNSQQPFQKVEFMAQNFEDIFMKVKQNRSEGILRHNNILKIKQKIFNKRYSSSKQFQMFIDQDKLQPSKNKKLSIQLRKKGHPQYQQKINYLKGIKIQGLADSIKISLQQKINKTNRVKEQFMKIHSQCKNCHCYDDIQTTANNLHKSGSNQNSKPRSSSNMSNYQFNKDPKYHTMKIGVNWRSQNRFKQDEPLQSIYRRITIVNEKNRQKYKHGAHLFQRKKQLMSRQRRQSAPILSNNLGKYN